MIIRAIKKLSCFIYTHDREWKCEIETDQVGGDFRLVQTTYQCKRCGHSWQQQEAIIDRIQYPGGVKEWLLSRPVKNSAEDE